MFRGLNMRYSKSWGPQDVCLVIWDYVTLTLELLERGWGGGPISKMATWRTRSKGLLSNVSVCHIINISDSIAILFFIGLLIIFVHNFEEKAWKFPGWLPGIVFVTQKDLWPVNISVHCVININDRINSFFHMFNNNFEHFQDGHPWHPKGWRLASGMFLWNLGWPNF